MYESYINKKWKVYALSAFAVLLFLWLIKAPLMGAFISDKTRLPVTLRAISIWPRETTIRHFAIKNPGGFGEGQALKAGKVRIDYRYHRLTSTPAEIDQITIDNPTLYIEILDATGKENNWSKIGTHIATKKKTRGMIVHKLLINNMTVEVYGKGAAAMGAAGTQHFDQMEFDEINSQEGFPTRELLTDIFQRAGVGGFVNDALNPGARIDEAVNPFGIF